MAAQPRLAVGQTHWPSERVFVLLTPTGAIAREGGVPMFFTDQNAALDALKPGYFIAGIDVFRVVVIAAMAPTTGSPD